jgi:alpha-tubulin suppressor-like RCC1 family protein
VSGSFFSGLSDQKNAASSMKNDPQFETQNSKLTRNSKLETRNYLPSSFFIIPASIFKLIRLKILELRYLPHLEIRLVHDKTYAKGGTYKRYSDNPLTPYIHKATAFAFTFSFIIFTLAQLLFPIFNLWQADPVLAGAHSVTWSTTGDFAYNKSSPNLCEEVQKSQVVISGSEYTDPTCVANDEDGTLILDFGIVFLSDITAISAGRFHSMALKSDGTVYAWGRNNSGQLGDGTITERSTPVQVKGVGGEGNLTNITAISAGGDHSIAIKNDGTVYAWGSNSTNQLGNGAGGSGVISETPIQVPGVGGEGNLTNIIDISGLLGSSVALKADGTVYEWGSTVSTQRTTPTQVLGVGGSGYLTNISVLAPASGNHRVALKSDGTVYAWGSNSYGQLGNNSTSSSLHPVQVLGVGGSGYLINITAISAGGEHSMALKNDGTVYSWGRNNYNQLGDNTTTTRTSPVQVLGVGGSGYLTNITAVSAGSQHSMALKNDGTVYAWGRNNSGQLGNNTTTNRGTATQVFGVSGDGFLTDILKISIGDSYSMVLKNDGTVYAWGNNSYSQLGNNSTTQSNTPIQVLAVVWEMFLAPGTISGLKIDAGSGKKANWSTINWSSLALPSNTNIVFNVRTSDNNSTWSNWSSNFTQSTAGSTSGSGSLSSAAKTRYLEIRMTLNTTDGENTPTLNSFTVTYDTLESPANNQTTIYRSDGSTKLKTSEGTEVNAGVPGGWSSESSVKVTATGLSCESCGESSGRKIQAQYNPVDTAFSDETTNLVEGEYVDNSSSTANITGLSPGNYHLRLRTVDDQGRVSGWTSYGGNTDTTGADFSIEQTPPTGTVTINEGEYTKNATVTLTLSAADTGGSGLTEMRFSNNGSDWSDWETYGTSKAWTLTEGDGAKTVYAQYRDNAGNISGTWLQTSDADFNGGLTKTNITIENNAIRIADYVDPHAANYLPGRPDTAMAGKEVYYQNETSTLQWKTTDTACVGPQCATGLDPNHSANYALVADNTVDFSLYTARNACKAVGGRLPYMNELLELYAGRASYGNNFGTGGFWSATEAPFNSVRFVSFNNGGTINDTKTNSHYVRCIRQVETGNYLNSGIFDSAIYDFGSEIVQLKLTNFSTDIPANTAITLSARAGNTATPDGTWTSYYTLTSGQNVPSELNNKRYLQYRATLTSSDGMNTPTLHDISFESAYTASTTLDTVTPTINTYSVESASGSTDYVTEANRLITAKGIFEDGSNTNNLLVQFSQDGTNWGKYSGSGTTNLTSTDWTNYISVTPHATNLQTLTSAWYLEGGDGQKTLYIRAKDGAGNEVGDGITDTLTLDTAGPVITDNQGGDDTWRKENNGTYDVDFADTGAGLKSFETKVTSAAAYGGSVVQDWTKVSDLTGASYTTNWQLLTSTWDALPQGTSYVYVRAYDNLDQVNESADFVFTVKKDTVLPTSAISSPINEGKYNATSWPGSASGTASDATAGLSKVELTLKRNDNKYFNGTSWVDGEQWVTATGTTSWSYTLNPANFTDGATYTLSARATDNANNVQTEISSVSFTYDEATPTGTIVIANDNPYTTTLNVWLQLTADGDVDKMAISTNPADLEALTPASPLWENYAASVSKSLAAGADGTRNIYVRFMDYATNISVVSYSDSILYDSTAPVSTISSPTNNAQLNALTALSGTSFEAGSGITNTSQVKIAILNGINLYWNGVIFDASEVWLNVSSLSGTKPNYTWTYDGALPNWVNDDYTIKVYATDNASKVEAAGSGNTIRFDSSGPTISTLSSSSHPNQATWYSVSNVLLSWLGDDSASGNTGISGYSYQFNQTADTIPDTISEGTATNLTLNDTADGLWYFHVRAVDGAGNWGETAHYAVRVDTTAPTPGATTFAANGVDDTQINLNWDAYLDTNAGVAEYKLYRSTTSNTPQSTTKEDPGLDPTSLTYAQLLGTITAEGQADFLYEDTGLAEGWYYYLIYAFDKANPTNQSAAIYSHSKTNFIPDEINLTVNGTTGPITFEPGATRSLNLSWQATDPDGRDDIITTKFTVKRPDGTILATFDQTNTGNLTRTEIENGYNLTGTYTIPADSGWGNYTVYATTVDTIVLNAHTRDSNTVTVKLIPAHPQNTEATGYSSTQINLTWESPAITTGLRASDIYEVERKLASEPVESFSLIGFTNDLIYYNTGLSMDTEYSYRVRSYDVSDNPGVWSAAFSATTPKPVAPTSASVKDASHTTIDLGGSYPVRYLVSWDAVNAETVPDLRGYKLYRETNGIWSETPVAEININTLGFNQSYYLDLHAKEAQTDVYRYRVATWDEAGNIGDPVVTLATNVSSTPEITAQPTIVETGVSWIKLTWKSNQSTAGLVEYKRAAESSYSNYAGDPRVTTTQDGSDYVHTITVRGLEKGTSYNFKVKSVSPSSVMSSASSTVTAQTKSFTISAIQKEVRSSSAVISWNTPNVTSEGYVEYKRGNAAEPKVVGTGKSATTHSIEIRDLTPGDYVFTLKNLDSEGNITTSSLESFTITGFDSGTLSSPQAGSVEEQDITATSAKITWTSSVATTSWIDYGTTSTNYTKSVGNDILTIDHIITMEGLTPGQTYYYIVRGVDANNTEYRSREFSFVALARPSISNVEIMEVTSYTAKIRVEVTKDVEASITYGTGGNLDKKAGSTTFAKIHTIELDTLEDGANYTFYVDVKDSAGNTARSETRNFATPLDTQGPKINQVKIDILPMGESDENASVIISWTTDKPSTTKVEYDEGIISGKYSKSSIEDDSLNTNHTVIIKELQPATTYHFRILSKDKRDNATYSNDFTFVTPSQEKSIFQLIVRSLEETFAWTKNLGSFFSNLREKVR